MVFTSTSPLPIFLVLVNAMPLSSWTLVCVRVILGAKSIVGINVSCIHWMRKRRMALRNNFGNWAIPKGNSPVIVSILNRFITILVVDVPRHPTTINRPMIPRTPLEKCWKNGWQDRRPIMNSPFSTEIVSSNRTKPVCCISSKPTIIWIPMWTSTVWSSVLTAHSGHKTTVSFIPHHDCSVENSVRKSSIYQWTIPLHRVCKKYIGPREKKQAS